MKPLYQKRQLEKTDEQKARDWAPTRGWIEYKLVSPECNGFPDRFYARRGVIILAEWKKPGLAEKGLSQNQIRRHKELREHGVTVKVFDTFEQFKKEMH